MPIRGKGAFAGGNTSSRLRGGQAEARKNNLPNYPQRGQASIGKTSSSARALRGQAAIGKTSSSARALRGQAAIELISILSVALIVLGAILAAAKSAHEDMQISLESKMLESGLSSLGKNAELAYRSGPGTIISSRLSIPYTAVEDGSYIGDGIINVRLEHKYGIRDVPHKISVPVEGDLSFLPGDYEVFAVSHRNYVFITSTPTLVASDNIIYLKGRPGEEKRASVGIRNPGDTGTTYRAVLDPLPDDAGVTLEWHSKNVDGGGSTELGIRAEPGTSYSGDILVTSSTGEYERIRLEIGN